MNSQSGRVETDEQDRHYYTGSGWEEGLDALLGSLLIIFIMVCTVYCLYKYAVCQEETREKRNGIPKKPIKIIVRDYDIV